MASCPTPRSPPGRSQSKRAPSRRSPPSVKASKSFSGPTSIFSTAASPTTAGCRNCPGRSPRLTWDNAALVSPRTAEEHGWQNEDLVELNYEGRKVRAPIWISPGHADNSVTVHLGYGRTKAGRVGNGVGFNAYALRTSDAPWFGSGLEIVKTGSKYPLASTQEQHLMEGRPIVISGAIDEYRKNPGFVREAADEPPKELSIYPGFKYEGYAWGMSIDQTACVGCNACVVACQAENNIAVVGKEQVLMRRAMHWLRIDTYYQGHPDNPEVYFQPSALHALRKCAVRAGLSRAGHQSFV